MDFYEHRLINFQAQGVEQVSSAAIEETKLMDQGMDVWENSENKFQNLDNALKDIGKIENKTIKNNVRKLKEELNGLKSEYENLKEDKSGLREEVFLKMRVILTAISSPHSLNQPNLLGSTTKAMKSTGRFAKEALKMTESGDLIRVSQSNWNKLRDMPEANLQKRLMAITGKDVSLDDVKQFKQAKNLQKRLQVLRQHMPMNKVLQIGNKMTVMFKTFKVVGGVMKAASGVFCVDGGITTALKIMNLHEQYKVEKDPYKKEQIAINMAVNGVSLALDGTSFVAGSIATISGSTAAAAVASVSGTVGAGLLPGMYMHAKMGETTEEMLKNSEDWAKSANIDFLMHEYMSTDDDQSVGEVYLRANPFMTKRRAPDSQTYAEDSYDENDRLEGRADTRTKILQAMSIRMGEAYKWHDGQEQDFYQYMRRMGRPGERKSLSDNVNDAKDFVIIKNILNDYREMAMNTKDIEGSNMYEKLLFAWGDSENETLDLTHPNFYKSSEMNPAELRNFVDNFRELVLTNTTGKNYEIVADMENSELIIRIKSGENLGKIREENRWKEQKNEVQNCGSDTNYAFSKYAEYFGYEETDLATLKEQFFTESQKEKHGVYWSPDDLNWMVNLDNGSDTKCESFDAVIRALNKNPDRIFTSRYDATLSNYESETLTTQATDLADKLEQYKKEYELVTEKVGKNLSEIKATLTSIAKENGDDISRTLDACKSTEEIRNKVLIPELFKKAQEKSGGEISWDEDPLIQAIISSMSPEEEGKSYKVLEGYNYLFATTTDAESSYIRMEQSDSSWTKAGETGGGDLSIDYLRDEYVLPEITKAAIAAEGQIISCDEDESLRRVMETAAPDLEGQKFRLVGDEILRQTSDGVLQYKDFNDWKKFPDQDVTIEEITAESFEGTMLEKYSKQLIKDYRATIERIEEKYEKNGNSFSSDNDLFASDFQVLEKQRDEISQKWGEEILKNKAFVETTNRLYEKIVLDKEVSSDYDVTRLFRALKHIAKLAEKEIKKPSS